MTGEMAQTLGELAAFAEDQVLVPSTHMEAHTIFNSRPKGSGVQAPHTHTYM